MMNSVDRFRSTIFQQTPSELSMAVSLLDARLFGKRSVVSDSVGRPLRKSVHKIGCASFVRPMRTTHPVSGEIRLCCGREIVYQGESGKGAVGNPGGDTSWVCLGARTRAVVSKRAG